MSICEKCQNKICLVNKKPCEAVEKLLRKDKIFSQDYIRPRLPSKKRTHSSIYREIPFSSLNSHDKEYLRKSCIDDDFGDKEYLK